ncbi:FAD:protein FMN transferase [Microcella sp.]|uniref:FAD:protein FMN transferase n=1 Tax=Microcella sp. TaxID=1913979 RepID=UPI00256768EE|nr:FAD:protein FMN transferase [Microcella sp.]MBX9471773.1 FAD:protein FMN transferase [Microcella sp.]
MPSRAEARPSTVEPSNFNAIGVPWRIGVGTAETPTSSLGAPLAHDDLEAVMARIEQFDLDWSRFRDDSLVSRIARAPGSWRLPADAAPLFALYEQLHAMTDARVSPLVGASLERLGYDAAYRLSPAGDALPAPSWADSIALRKTADGLVLDTVAPVQLDVGAAGKGYLVDLIGDLLAARGVTETLVDASGDVRVRGERSIRIALEHPADPTKAVGVAEVTDAALCGSAINRRAWGEGLHHIVDAVTGRPVADGVVATWVVADSALLADGLATALFFVEPARLCEAFAFEWVRLSTHTGLEASAGFRGELFA